MNLFNAMEISATGLNAQRTVINAISTNLANVHSTRTDEGGPYRRKQAVLSSSPMNPVFSTFLSNSMDRELAGVKVDVVEDFADPELVYDPTHPDADESGYVAMPNVNTLEEMVYLLGAVRSYEANVTAFNAAKMMAVKSLEIGK